MIIVTGGAGFIGSNIVSALTKQGKEVVVIDVLEEGDKWKNLAKHKVLDLVFPEDTFNYLNKHSKSVEAIIHMGACSSTVETDVDYIMENNFCFSKDLWEWCTEHNIPFIYASSAATYGDGAQGFDDALDEEQLGTLLPLNPYGWSKHLFDRAALHESTHTKNTPPQWVGLKFFNVYGPNEYHKAGQRSVAHQLFEQISEHKEARLFKSYMEKYPDGGQLRDFIWVGDCVSIVLWFLENPSVSGVYNVGTGHARSFHDLAKAAFKALNVDENVTFIDMPESLRDKYQYFTQATTQKLQKAGYKKPYTSLEDGVATYFKQYLSTKDPYE